MLAAIVMDTSAGLPTKARNRNDPANSLDYRNGDQGYSSAYGSRDAYRSNYRAGFRQGYEEGYREATR